MLPNSAITDQEVTVAIVSQIKNQWSHDSYGNTRISTEEKQSTYFRKISQEKLNSQVTCAENSFDYKRKSQMSFCPKLDKS